MADIHLSYGTYNHASGECQVGISREPLDAGGGRPYGYLEKWDVVGVLNAADQTALTAAIAAMVAAYTPGKTIGLYYEGGSPTTHVLTSASTRDGTKILKPPTFSEGRGGEYSTYRSYSLQVGGVVPVTDYSILSWEEDVDWLGTGGADWGIVVGQNALQAQTFRNQTVVTMVQSGRAVGRGSYPTPNSPLWPQYEHLPSRRIRKRRNNWTGLYEVTWSFTFYAATQLSGAPTAKA